MKQKHNYLLRYIRLPLLLPVLLTGCTDSLGDLSAISHGDKTPLEFQASINQINTSRADESGFADGDRFGVFVVNRNNGEAGTLSVSGNQVNNLALTYDAANNRWNQATPVYWLDNVTKADFYGYYPFDNALSDVEKYSFEVRADQSVSDDGEMSSYEASDFLWAVAENVTPGTKVNLVFHHRLAGVKVVLQEGTGFGSGEWESLSRVVTVDNTVRTANISLSTGIATPSGVLDRHIVASPEGDTYRAVVIPQSVASGESIIGITIDGVTYNYVREGGMNYTPGKLHTFTLKIDKKDGNGKYTLIPTGETISPWEVDSFSHAFDLNSYLMVDVLRAGTLRGCLVAMNCELSTIRNLKITGQLKDEDFRVMREEMPLLTSLNLSKARMVDINPDYGADWGNCVNDMIPHKALQGKESLRRIILPESITHIGYDALSGLWLTSTLTLPESVINIGHGAFAFFGGDCSVILPSSLEYIGPWAFAYFSAKMELNLTNSISYIGERAFESARGVYGVFSLPSGLEYLGDRAFAGCGTDLTGSIVIPEGIKVIPENVFDGMGFRSATTVTFHSGITKIESCAFQGIHLTGGLKLPNSIKYIGNAAFRNCGDIGSLVFPKGIAYLGGGAFSYSGIAGDLVYPESIDYVYGDGGYGGAFRGTNITSLTINDHILQIGEAAFEDCRELKRVTIGKNVASIGERAFNNCENLEIIVCLANEPPACGAECFSGFLKEYCIVEVPESAIGAYRVADGWKEFANITPHKELSFSMSQILCLDKGMVREGRLTAEGPWAVNECPSWVHVSPVSGQTKDQLTVTIDPLPYGEEERDGRIVFTLSGKDYTTYTDIRQMRYEECDEDREIVLQEATAGNKAIPVFIVGEGFDADNIISGEYMRRMRETMDQFFAIEPYKSYRERFTVTTAVACSPENGVGDVFTVKENCFDTSWLTPDEWKLREYVQKVSQHAGHDMGNALIIVVANRECFDGWSTIGYDGCSIACIGISDDVYPYDQRGLVQYYAGGEAFAGLGSEAVAHFDHIKGCTCPYCNQISKFLEMKSRGYLENLTMSSKMTEAPWIDFIYHPKYSAMVDMWEGGYNHFRGVWRSEANSVMNTYIAYFNTVSRYAIYKQIKRRTGETASLEDFIANDIIEIP